MTSWAKGKRIQSSAELAKVHGHIPGYPPGSRFSDRFECSAARVHAPLRAGIHGNLENGAYSVVLSFGYEDDEDHGEWFNYTGAGGRDTQGDKLDQMKGKVKWEGEQNADQEWVRGNKALKVSSVTKKPVRVIRGANRKKGSGSRFAPMDGYRYDGLYVVEEAWRAPGKTGFLTCRFRLRRLPNQPPLPGAVAQSQKSQDTSEQPAPIPEWQASHPLKPHNGRRHVSEVTASLPYSNSSGRPPVPVMQRAHRPPLPQLSSVPVTRVRSRSNSTESGVESLMSSEEIEDTPTYSQSVQGQGFSRQRQDLSPFRRLSTPLRPLTPSARHRWKRSSDVRPLQMLPIDGSRRSPHSVSRKQDRASLSEPGDSSGMKAIFGDTDKYAGLKFKKMKKGD